MESQESSSDEFGLASILMLDSYQLCQIPTSTCKESQGVFSSGSSSGFCDQSSLQVPSSSGINDAFTTQSDILTLADQTEHTLFSRPQLNACQTQLSPSPEDPSMYNFVSPSERASSLPKHGILSQKPKSFQYSHFQSTVPMARCTTDNRMNQTSGYLKTWDGESVNGCFGTNTENRQFSVTVPRHLNQDKCLKWLTYKPQAFASQAGRNDSNFPNLISSSDKMDGNVNKVVHTQSQLLALPKSSVIANTGSIATSQFLWNNNPVSVQSIVKSAAVSDFQSNRTISAPNASQLNKINWPGPRLGWMEGKELDKQMFDATKAGQLPSISSDWLKKKSQSNTRGQNDFLRHSSLGNVCREVKPQYQITTNHPKWSNSPKNNTFFLEDFLNAEYDQKMSNSDMKTELEEVSVPMPLDSSSESLFFPAENGEQVQYEVVCPLKATNEKSGGQQWLKHCQQMLKDIDHGMASLEKENISEEEKEVGNRSFEIMEDDAQMRPDNEGIYDLPIHLAETAPSKRRNFQTPSILEAMKTPSRLNGKRKPLIPIKSPRARDPTFRGVLMKMKTEFQDDRAHLDIRAYFSCKKNCRRHQHLKKRYLESNADQTKTQPEILVPPSAIIEKEFQLKEKKRRCPLLGKQCASCGTKKTPLWRDAEDGTSLCNACGIRFKKYRVRCTTCWHIPRKDTKTDPTCHRCGEILKVPPMSSKVCF